MTQRFGKKPKLPCCFI